MEPLVFKRGTWHYWLANFGEKRVYESTDICAYIRYVLIGLFFATLFSFIGIGVVTLTLFALYDIFMWLFYNGEFTPTAKVLLLTVGMLGGIVVSVLGFVYFKTLRDHSPDNFVVAAYDKFKNKTCRRVELVE